MAEETQADMLVAGIYIEARMAADGTTHQMTSFTEGMDMPSALGMLEYAKVQLVTGGQAECTCDHDGESD